MEERKEDEGSRFNESSAQSLVEGGDDDDDDANKPAVAACDTDADADVRTYGDDGDDTSSSSSRIENKFVPFSSFFFPSFLTSATATVVVVVI